MQTLGLPKDAAHFYSLPNDWVQLLELLNKVWDLGLVFASRVFGWCVEIAESGRISAVEPCLWFGVEINRPVTRRLKIGVVL
jgi:hypothetical protein